MKRSLCFCIVIILITEFSLSAQDTSSNGKALNIPFKKYGLSIGNSYEFNGIRINFADNNVKRINGLNITFWLFKDKSTTEVVNGISLGVIPTASRMGPINIGVLGVGTSNNNLNGFSFGGIGIGSGGNVNGLSMGGLLIMTDGDSSKISGISIAGLGIGAMQSLNGIGLAGFGIGSDGNINGLTACLAFISCKKNYNGIAFTGYLKSNIYNGVAIAGYSRTNEMFGLSVALYNRTDELHGLQIGLLNYAGNNPKGLKYLPGINLHF